MAGIIVVRSHTGKGAILKVPRKGQEPQNFFTSVHEMRRFVEGKTNFFYFNMSSDFRD